MRNIYEKAIATLPPDHINHALYSTDLYIKVTPESRALIAEYDFKNNVEIFRSPLDGCLWFDIPFAYTPEWERRYKEG